MPSPAASADEGDDGQRAAKAARFKAEPSTVVLSVVMVVVCIVAILVPNLGNFHFSGSGTAAAADPNQITNTGAGGQLLQSGSVVVTGQYIFWANAGDAAADETAGVYRSNRDGTGLVEVSDAEPTDGIILDGDTLYFIAWGGNAGEQGNYLVRIGLDGSGYRELTDKDEVAVQDMQIVQGRIYYTYDYVDSDDDDEEDDTGVIAAINEDGSGQSDLYSNSNGVDSFQISGDTIYFIVSADSNDDDSQSELYSLPLANTAAARPHEFTQTAGCSDFKVIGSEIFYLGEDDDADTILCMISCNDSDNHVLLDGSINGDRYRDFDEFIVEGSKVFFVADIDYGEDDVESLLCSFDINSSAVTVIRKGKDDISELQGNDGWLYFSVWTDDVSGTSYQNETQDTDGGYNLYRLNLNGGNAQLICDDAIDDYSIVEGQIYYQIPTWQSSQSALQFRVIGLDGTAKITVSGNGSMIGSSAYQSTPAPSTSTSTDTWQSHTYILYYENWCEYSNQVTDWLNQHPQVAAHVTLVLASTNPAVQYIPCLYIDGAQFGTGADTVVQKLEDDFSDVVGSATSNAYSPSTVTNGQSPVSGQSSAAGSNVSHADLVPDSATSKISASDLAGLTDAEIEVAINEIYARHGRPFTKIKELDTIFYTPGGYYNGRYSEDSSFKDSDLSSLETKNAITMRKLLRKRGYTSYKADAQLVKQFVATYGE
ncbi:MAG: DUF5050 domain-containing protein [Coriobacteriales bacterium]|nr:DUF5050 domain-containing protein [Coriobacteriales bacterium]